MYRINQAYPSTEHIREQRMQRFPVYFYKSMKALILVRFFPEETRQKLALSSLPDFLQKLMSFKQLKAGA
jgi:hypothetical protein